MTTEPNSAFVAKEENEPIVPSFVEAVNAILANKKPMGQAEYRKHLLETQIYPTMDRWGFEPRFRQQLSSLHPKQAKVLNNMRDKMTGQGAIVALVGIRGVGKTSIAAQFALEIAERNYAESIKEEGPRKIQHVVYRKCNKLISRYKPIFADFGSIDTEALTESLERLCHRQEFLVIDEVHDCEDMKMRSRVLTDIVDQRYAALLDTVLIANQTPEDFASTIGDSILSRLNEHGAILPCNWPSYRDAR